MILDRTIPPSFEKIKSINIPTFEKYSFENSIKLFEINSGNQNCLKLELIFDAGSKFEKNTGQSLFTSKLLGTGTSTYSSKQIEEYFANIGYFIEYTQGIERVIITIYGLNKFFKEALFMLHHIIDEAVFHENELANLKQITQQNILLNLEKSDFVASQTFKEKIFGSENYLGKTLKISDIESIDISQINEFYQAYFHKKSFTAVLSGKITAKEIGLIKESLVKKEINYLPINTEIPQPSFIKNETNIFVETKENTIQSSIRLGRLLFDRKHQDYYKFRVMCTVLGGYFGSRLMKNIREEKGYTYGISASHIPLQNTGYFMIGTDVKKEFTKNTLSEIEAEINNLQQFLVEDDELERVKNFIIGDFAGSFNSPFDLAARIKVLIFEGLDVKYWHNYIHNINNITSQHIQEMAKKYLNKEQLTTIIVGGI